MAAVRHTGGECPNCAALRARVAELEQQLAASQAEVAALKAAMDSDEARARRAAAEAAAAEAARLAALEAERLARSVVVYGRAGDPKTAAMHKQLRSAGIEFIEMDFDKDKDKYQEALKASGHSGKLIPPVVVRGKQAWWDEPDAAIAVHFPSMVVNELRKLGLGADIAETAAPLKKTTMESEMYTRFQNMQQAFLKADKDQDGRITKKELLILCKQWHIPSAEAQRALTEADTNMDGTLDFDEFARQFGQGPPT